MTLTKEQVLKVLEDRNSHGATWKELKNEYNAEHQSVSATLNNLHEEGLVFALKEERDGCQPYVFHTFRLLFLSSERIDRPNKVIAWQILKKVVDAYENGEDLSDLIKEGKDHIYK